MFRRSLIPFVSLLGVLSLTAVFADRLPADVLPRDVSRVLAAATGDPDPGLSARIARRLSGDQLVTAFYRGSRSERLVAIDAAAEASDPWPILPFLAALAQAKEREVASRAVRAMRIALERELAPLAPPAEVPAGQLAQLDGQLGDLGADGRLDADVRVVAIQLRARLVSEGLRADPSAAIALLNDDEPAVRAAALSGLRVPLAEELLGPLAGIVESGKDRPFAALAGAVLCENALAHRVVRLTEDLEGLLEQVLADPGSGAAGVGAVLACLADLPAAARADLVDRALQHPDPAVGAFWQEIEEQER